LCLFLSSSFFLSALFYLFTLLYKYAGVSFKALFFGYTVLIAAIAAASYFYALTGSLTSAAQQVKEVEAALKAAAVEARATIMGKDDDVWDSFFCFFCFVFFFIVYCCWFFLFLSRPRRLAAVVQTPTVWLNTTLTRKQTLKRRWA
jgi:hypothetical protein